MSNQVQTTKATKATTPTQGKQVKPLPKDLRDIEKAMPNHFQICIVR
ncbi:hypothetical protein ACFBZI_11620 [Moraxella sp. ZJ142]